MASGIPVLATLLLHAALLAAIIRGLPSPPAYQPPSVLSVSLLPPAAPPQAAPPAPAAPPPPSPPAPAAAPAAPAEAVPAPAAPRKRRRPQAQPRIPATPAPAPAPAAAEPPAPAEAEAAPATPSAPPPAAPAPAAPAPEIKTGASEARYAGSNRRPSYPRLSRMNGEQGTVVLRVLVREDGSAGTVELKSSSGFPLLDESALSAVRQWRFHPATVNGKPVAEWYQLSIPFKLQDDQP